MKTYLWFGSECYGVNAHVLAVQAESLEDARKAAQVKLAKLMGKPFSEALYELRDNVTSGLPVIVDAGEVKVSLVM